MKRKDCDKSNTNGVLRARAAMNCARFSFLLFAMAGFVSDSTATAGQVRLWSSAVVVADSIRLVDIAQVQGFDVEEESRLAKMAITTAPPAGGSRIIHIEMLRAVLAAGGINMARVTFGGAAQCEVSRPSAPAPSAPIRPEHPDHRQLHPDNATEMMVEGTKSGPTDKTDAQTLRGAVQEFFDSEFARYGGAAEVIFDHTDDQVLGLSGPAYGFNVRRRGNAPLGLCPLEVDVLSNQRTIQTIPIVVQATMQRKTVVARRSINQGATVGPADVEAVTMGFTRLDQLGLDDVAMAVGQRAKRFISAGSTIDLDMLEAVPLVLRGQLVTLNSTVGGVRIVTTAKAGSDGMLGETIKVRSVDDKRLEYDAVVIGPGEVRIGAGGPHEPNEVRFAGLDVP